MMNGFHSICFRMDIAGMPQFMKNIYGLAENTGQTGLDGEPIYEDHPVCFNVKDLGYQQCL